MAETLTFWMTVVGTIAGVVSMVVAVLDRRGPRRPRQGPGLLRKATGSCLYGTLMMAAISIVVCAPVVNIGALVTGFDLNPFGCAIGLALNVLGIPLDRWGGVPGETEHKVYAIFCAPFILIYALLLIAA
jgi:hypothetical protein